MNHSISTKGLILAAGFGQRLRPITDSWPKPLIPFIGTTPLALAYQQLYQLKLQAIWINTHYRHNDFSGHISCFPNFPQMSHEPVILGTGGAINPMRSTLSESNLIIVNGDVIAPFDLSGLLKHHLDTKAVATMILLPRVIPGETAVWFHNQKIIGIQKDEIPGAQAGNFACAQILSPEFIKLLPEFGTFDIINYGYRKALANNMPISYILHNDYWFDIGTPQSYLNAVQSVLIQGQNKSTHSHALHLQLNTCRKWYGKQALNQTGIVSDIETSPEGLICSQGTVIERGAYIGNNVQLTRSIILPDSNIPSDIHLENSICGPFGILNPSRL